MRYAASDSLACMKFGMMASARGWWAGSGARAGRSGCGGCIVRALRGVAEVGGGVGMVATGWEVMKLV